MACDRSPRIGGEAGFNGAAGSLAGMAFVSLLGQC